MSVRKFVNIIGYGYVGSALGYVCNRNNVDFCTYDVIAKDEPGALHNFDDIDMMIRNSEAHNDINVYFICVPTPPSPETGECNTAIVESILDVLSTFVKKRTYVIIKSTVKPGTTRSFQERYGNEYLSVTFCPEFLRERTFQEDMYNCEFVLLGVNNVTESDPIIDVMKHVYNHNRSVDVIVKTYEECELFKYTINVFLSVKVWFFNEVDVLCDKLGVEYKSLQKLFVYEPRIGESHTDVPGHDGKRGFGGKCLPKETKAMAHLQATLGIDNDVLRGILKRNLELRGSDD